MKKHFYRIIFLASTAGLVFSCAGKKMAHFAPSSPKPYGYVKTKAQPTGESQETAMQHVAQVRTLAKPVIEENYSVTTIQESNTTEASNTVEVIEEIPSNIVTENMSKKDIKNAIKGITQTTNDRTVFMNILLVILAIIIPPIAVLLVDGFRGPFWLSILLTLLFWLPGFIYALTRVFKKR